MRRTVAALLVAISLTAVSPEEPSVVLAGGCFWCLEAVYDEIPGVTETTCGYAGGTTSRPTYEQVKTGRTGHAEAVRVAYDPSVVSLERLLEVFWQAHDPATRDRQGYDVGSQYRSAIFYADERQRVIAEASRTRAAASLKGPITTQIVPLTHFWPAEEYHQHYFAKHPEHPYCETIIAPKVKKFRQHR